MSGGIDFIWHSRLTDETQCFTRQGKPFVVVCGMQRQPFFHFAAVTRIELFSNAQGLQLDDTIERARVDPKIDWSREGAPQGWKPTQENFEDFKRGLTRYVSQQIGGKEKYEGEDMRSVHQGMRITDEEFDAFMNHVRAALANHNVPKQEQQELVRVFEKTRNQIVAQRSPPRSPDQPRQED